MQYAEQSSPDGLVQAFIIGKKFIGNDRVCLILGDNIFWGHGFTPSLEVAASKTSGATIFGYEVTDPKRFGIVELDEMQRAITLEEKPANPKSNFAVTGLYFYDNDVIEIAKTIKPSSRGELEITSINQVYLERGNLDVELLGRGFTWLDTGTFDSLLEASTFVATIEKRQRFKIVCLEEIALNKGWITEEQVKLTADNYGRNSYSEYLTRLISN